MRIRKLNMNEWKQRTGYIFSFLCKFILGETQKENKKEQRTWLTTNQLIVNCKNKNRKKKGYGVGKIAAIKE